jgi:hypothetical protein
VALAASLPTATLPSLSIVPAPTRVGSSIPMIVAQAQRIAPMKSAPTSNEE